MNVAVYASETHFVDHMADVARTLGVPVVCGSRTAQRHARSLGLDVALRVTRQPGKGPVWMVAGFGDLRRIGRQPSILVEHGAGQTYGDQNPHYPGGTQRRHVRLFLCPSQRVADLNAAAYPDAEVRVVGCPKLPALAARRAATPRTGRTVVVAHHWPCGQRPECGWAHPHFADATVDLANQPDLDVAGHGHPRALGHLRPFWHSHGIREVAGFDQAIAEADVYVCDNSSTIFEAAALDVPVVLLNSPLYRRHVDLGLRFWEWADVGQQVDHPADLAWAVRAALTHPDAHADRRADVRRILYGNVDDPVGAACRAIMEVFG